MYQLSQTHLLQLLYEKDCYIKALEQQLELSRQEIVLLKSKRDTFVQNQSSDEDCNLDENSEPAISASRVEQFQSSGKKIKLKQPLQESNTYKRPQKCLPQKILDSIDVPNITIENTPKSTKGQIFDDFVILGLDESSTVIPKILYSFNSFQNQSSMLEVTKFIFPEGCKSKIIPLSFSVEDINLILHQNYSMDSQHCFVILTKQMEQQQLKYYHCYRYTDFTIMKKDSVHFSKRAICISSTKYLIDLFCQIITQILNQLKLMRLDSYSKAKNISLIDTKHFDQNLQFICHKYLSSMNQRTISSYDLPMTEKENISWGVPILFSRFNSSSLIKLFVSCLIEKSIVFVSKSPQLTTAACLLCQRYILKPFTWIHPIISNLPLENILYLGSPVPIIAGIECNYKSLQEKGIVNKFQNTIFINLDCKSSVEFGNPEVIPLLSAELMAFMQGKLDEYFTKYQTQPVHFNYLQCLQIFNQLFQQRVIRNIPTEPVLQQNLQYSKSHRKILDYQKIAEKTINNMGQLNADKFIWRQFFQTQVFIQFIDQYYH